MAKKYSVIRLSQVSQKRKTRTGSCKGGISKELYGALRELNEEEPLAENYSRNITEICEKSIPNRTADKDGRVVYWWRNKIAELSKGGQLKGRTFIRNKRRNLEHQNRENWKDLKRSKKTLKERKMENIL